MVKNFLYLVICTGLLSIFPVKFAHTDEVRFYINVNEVNLPIGIVCQGPFFRTSDCTVIQKNLGRFNQFYAAEINFFSPFGPWSCAFFTDPFCIGKAGSGNFCLVQRGSDQSVLITLKETIDPFSGDPHFTFSSNFPKTCNSSSTNAFLGDRPQQLKPDKDTFSFSDTEGDEVTLRLEEDGSVGHIGKEATFRLRGPAGTSLDEVKTGELPLEITATIPKSGDYEIVVDQKGITDNTRYRGGYVITLDSSQSDVNEIDPSQDVE
jgi:hypothetical protein